MLKTFLESFVALNPSYLWGRNSDNRYSIPPGMNIVTRPRLFELYAKFCWPVHRKFVKHSLAKRCPRCVASERMAPLTDGVCDRCREFAQHGSSPQVEEVSPDVAKEFDELLHSYEGQGKGQYDVLVLFSGGKDSAVLVDELMKRYPKLCILAFSVDTGYLSPASRDNISHIIQRLGIDHTLFRPPSSLFKKAYRYALTHLGDQGCYSVVDRVDGDLIHDIGRNFAAQMGIPLVLSGIAHTQVQHIFGIDWFELPREDEEKRRIKSGILPIDQVFDEKERAFWWDPARYPERVLPRIVFPNYVWRFSEAAIEDKVSRGRLIPRSRLSPLVTNSVLISLMGVIDIHQLGYSSFEPEFTQMIREGRAERQKWHAIFELLEYSAQTGWLLDKEIIPVLKSLNLTKKEVGIR